MVLGFAPVSLTRINVVRKLVWRKARSALAILLPLPSPTHAVVRNWRRVRILLTMSPSLLGLRDVDRKNGIQRLTRRS